MAPPRLPEIGSAADTSNFEDIDDVPPLEKVKRPASSKAFTGDQLPFVGFTFTRESVISDRLVDANAPQPPMTTPNRRLSSVPPPSLLTVDTPPARPVPEGASASQRHSAPGDAEARARLEQQIAQLTDRIAELEEQLQLQVGASARGEDDKVVRRLEREKKELESRLDEATARLQTSEKMRKMLKDSKDELEATVSALETRTSKAKKEVADLQAEKQRLEGAAEENEEKAQEATTKLSRAERDLRERKAELESVQAQRDQAKAETLAGEKKRLELQGQLDDALAEARKERLARTKAERLLKSAEGDLEDARSRVSARGAGDAAQLQQQREREFAEERSRLEALAHEHEDALRLLTEQLAEAKAAAKEAVESRAALETEIEGLRSSLQRTRRTSVVTEDAIADVARKYDKEMESLKKAVQAAVDDAELIRTRGASEAAELKAQMERAVEKERETRQFLAEEEKGRVQLQTLLEDARRDAADARAQLEKALSSLDETKGELVDAAAALHDEKDRREKAEYTVDKLQAEVSNLRRKQETKDIDWERRRTQKVERQELKIIQQDLEAEIQAKLAIEAAFQQLKAQKEAVDREIEEVRSSHAEMETELRTLREERQEEMKKKWRKDFVERPITPASSSATLPRGASQLSVIRSSSFASGSDSVPDLREAALMGATVGRMSATTTAKVGSFVDVSSVGEDASEATNVGTTAHSHSAASAVEAGGKAHKFAVRSFYNPTKCDVCGMPLLGLMRQGIVCDDCGYNCHHNCQAGAFQRCPTPANQKGLQLRDPMQPSGVVMEGFLRVPRPGGVRKGWRRHYVVLAGAQMLLFNGEDQKQGQEIISTIDLRASDFRVENVSHADVIHANRKEIPLIFRVVYSTETSKRQIFFQADTEAAKVTWVTNIARVASIVTRESDSPLLACRALFDSASCGEPIGTVLRSVSCIVRTDRFLLFGSDDGLCCIKLYVQTGGLSKFGEGKRVAQMEVLAAEKLVVLITGKSRQLRVMQMAAFEADGGSLAPALDETKGCTFFATGTYQKVTCIAVAIKRKILLYNARSLKKLKDIPVQDGCTGAFFLAEGLCIALSGKFLLIDATSNEPKKLLDPADASTNFLFNQAQEMVPMAAFQLETSVLLCFNYIGLFVNKDGRASDVELKWTSVPQHIAYFEPHVLAYAPDYVDVFDVRTGALVQTLALPGPAPMCRDGSMVLCTDLDVLTVVHVRDAASGPEVTLPTELIRSNSAGERPRMKRRTSAELRISISQPMNFQHVAHSGTPAASPAPPGRPSVTAESTSPAPPSSGTPTNRRSMVGGPPPPQQVSAAPAPVHVTAVPIATAVAAASAGPLTATRLPSAESGRPPVVGAPAAASVPAPTPAPAAQLSSTPAHSVPAAVSASPVAAPTAAPQPAAAAATGTARAADGAPASAPTNGGDGTADGTKGAAAVKQDFDFLTNW
eukprot:Opistho-2@61473